MNVLGQNQKTTVLGILIILGALIHAGTALYSGQAVDWTATFTTISGGIGLIAAKDSTTHSTALQVNVASLEAGQPVAMARPAVATPAPGSPAAKSLGLE